MDAARRAFAERGRDGASMRGIAADAGLTVMALYHYADSKDALFDLVFAEEVGDIYVEYAQVVIGCTSLIEEIDALLDHSARILRDRPEHTRLVLRALVDRERTRSAQVDLWDGAVAEFFDELADRAAGRSEIEVSEQRSLVSFLSTMLWGLTALNAYEPGALEGAIGAAKWAARRQFPPG